MKQSKFFKIRKWYNQKWLIIYVLLQKKIIIILQNIVL